MQDQNKQQNQTRFMLAAVLSLIVLTASSYFFSPEKPPENADANSNVSQNKEAKPIVEKPEEEKASEEPTKEEESSGFNEIEEAENRTIKIKTPLYEVTLDSKGAVATSWVLLLNDSPDESDRKLLYAQDSNELEKKPLELISKEGLERKPDQVPFKLATNDPNIDKIVNNKNYEISVSDNEIELKGSETKQIDFILKGSGNLSVKKSFLFKADSYVSDLSLTLKKDDQSVPNVKLIIGPSVGDQGIERYDFYKVEPEGVYTVGGDSNRQYAVSIIEDEGKGKVDLPGDVDWAGIADTYFAMVAVPAVQTDGLKFTSEKYDVETKPFYNGIIAWITRSQSTETTKHLMTAYVPITSDGTPTRVYTGTKDYFVLHEYNNLLSEQTGRTIDIEDVINYGYLWFVTKPLSVPILYCLKFLYSFTFNYGISIILFTLFFYSLLFPLRWFSSKSFKKAQKNAPKMKELQDKMKAMQKKGVSNEDPEMRKLQMEQLKMTKDALPIGGCLPLILQFPLLIALYITVSIFLGFRQETFLWLPDLSSGDPYHILEFAFAISMVLSFKFSPTTPAVTPEQQMQQKIMTYMMPIMMLWIMWSAPSGLLLYWFTGNIIMFAQQMIINWMNKDDATADAAAQPAK